MERRIKAQKSKSEKEKKKKGRGLKQDTNPDGNIFSMIDQPTFISIWNPRFPTTRVSVRVDKILSPTFSRVPGDLLNK